jgi:hypothetical protein
MQLLRGLRVRVSIGQVLPRKRDAFQTKAGRVMLRESPEFRRLRYAVEKAAGDSEPRHAQRRKVVWR